MSSATTYALENQQSNGHSMTSSDDQISSLMSTHNHIRYEHVPYTFEMATPTSSSYHKLTQELVNHITGFGLLLSLHEWLVEERMATDNLDDFGWFPPKQSDMIEFHVISSGTGEFDPYPYDDDKDID